MTIRNMIAAFSISVLSACQTTVDAPPWDLPKPEMTVAHQNSAEAANIVQKRLPDGNRSFGQNPNHVNWDWQIDKNRTEPMSNMTVANLTSLINGKYHIRVVGEQVHWSVGYYAADGKTHICGYKNGKYREWILDRYVTASGVGLAGIFHWDPEKKATPIPPEDSFAWPVVADSDYVLLALSSSMIVINKTTGRIRCALF